MDRGMKHGLEAIADLGRKSFLSELLRLLRAEFAGELVSVVVYGSVARGLARPESDTDVIVVTKSMPAGITPRMRRLVDVMDRLEETKAAKDLKKRGINAWVQFHPLSMKEARLHRPIYLDVVEDGVILYDSKSFMESVMEELRGRLEELGAKRVFLADGSWYWDLKPNIRRGEAVEI